jgi:hypothetical protein
VNEICCYHKDQKIGFGGFRDDVMDGIHSNVVGDCIPSSAADIGSDSHENLDKQ